MSYCVSRLFRAMVLLLLALPLAAPAQSTFSNDNTFARLSPAQAKELLTGFRNYRLSGDFCFDFTIRHVLRHDEKETLYHGTLWGSWNSQGPVFRVELTPGASNDTRRFILQSGPQPALWLNGPDGQPRRVGDSSTEPLLPGLIFTPFELQTPFTYWADATYRETRRFRGRPTHYFQMLPPEEFKRTNPEISAVRLGFDRAYNALMQASIYNAQNREIRRLEAEDFRKVQEQYIPEEIRLHDTVSRNKDIFRVTAAALRLQLPRSVFDPATLNAPAGKPAEKSFSKLD